MSSEVVRVFELFGKRFEITAEFDAYNAVRSQQARDVYAIFSRYMASIQSMEEDLNRLTKKSLNDLISVVSRINTEFAVATVGFEELKRYQSDILPRIGKRLIFKYTDNELITVNEIAEHIQLDTEKHFSSFLNEVQKLENDQQSDWVRREYARMTRNTPVVGGSIGTGMDAVAGVLVANAGTSLLHSLGSMITKAMDEAKANDVKKQAVNSGRKAILASYYDMANQMSVHCIDTLKHEMDEETAKIVRKAFQEVSEERREEIRAESENYYKAYQKGDITLERYTEHLISVLHYFPHNNSLYYALYQAALDAGSSQDQDAILEMTQYMGLEGQMDWWLAKQGLCHQSPSSCQGVNEKSSSSQPPTIFQQFAGTVYCMWRRPDSADVRPPLLFRTIGLQPDGRVWGTGNKEAWDFEDVLNWRDIVSVCSIGSKCFLIGLKADGSIVAHGIRRDSKFYQTITGWMDIVAIDGGYTHLLGLKKDGTVVAAYMGDSFPEDGRCSVSEWKGIASIAAGFRHSVGLRTNGTVVATGDNRFQQCSISHWRNIIAISSNSNFTIGLTREGKVIITSKDNPDGIYCSAQNIVSISAGNGHILLLREDGTVVAEGVNDCGQCNTSEWKDIVAVSAGDKYSIGVRKDGTLVSAGKNEFGERDIHGKRVGPYSIQSAQALKESDEQSAAWKAAGLCPFCGGQIRWLSKSCKVCNRRVD